MTNTLNFNDKIGILDYEGRELNPLNDKPYSNRYRELAGIWSKFPTYLRAEDILDAISNYQLVFVSSATGSGKSVIIPKLALHYTNYQGTILMTLPKRIITVSSASFASDTLDVELGKEIGYKFKNSPKEMANSNNKIIYVTDGILIMKYINDPLLLEYRVIIIDEAHERKIQIDLILLFLKNLLLSGKRPDLRIIIMSATISAQKYSDYFSSISSKIIEIPGQPNYPIDVHFLDKPTNSYMLDGLDLITELIPEKKDLLFFITTSNEAISLCRKIKPNHPKIFCIEVYADMDKDLKIYVESRDKFHELGNYNSKVIMATNVAESSLTIDGLKIVIDSGYQLSSRFDPIHMGRILEKERITRSQAIQRRGRVGRQSPGVCYHLMTEKQFIALEEYPAPSILTEDITMDLLRIMQISDNASFSNGVFMLNQLMDPPKAVFIDYAHSLFELYKIIDSNGQMNKIGYDITNFSSTPLNRILFMIYAFQLHCAKEACQIISMIEVSSGKFNNLFFKTDTLNQASFANKNSKILLDKLIRKSGDHLTFLNIFTTFKEQSDAKTWANQYGIKLDSLRNADKNSKKYYFKLVNLLRDTPQLSRISKTDTNKNILQALKLSHQHLTAKNLKPIFSKEKVEGKISKDSIVHHYTDRKKLKSAKFIYDEMIQIDDSWQYNIITLI